MMKNLTRRSFLQAGVAGLGAAALTKSAADEKESSSVRRPNVLYILCDQWRAQALSCYGDPNIQTTHIDALTHEGVRFTHCYSNSPVCSPYRAMLMSGRYPTRTGVYKNCVLLPEEEYCIAEAFGKAGYTTGYIGKWHLDGDGKPGFIAPGPRRQGWQRFVGHNRGHKYFNGVYFKDSPEPITIPEGSFEPDHQTNMAMEWIAEYTQQDKPWFVMLSWGGPHTPYEAPQNYMDMFNPLSFTLRSNVDENVSRPDDVSKKHQAKYYDKQNGLSATRANLQGYYAHAKNLDDNVGRLMKFLNEKGLSDNTLVIFTSDHGDMHHSQGYVFKSKPWEEAIGVPMIARWPRGIPAKREVKALLAGIDIFPTLCGLCGVPIPEGKDGINYSHLFRDQPGVQRESVFLSIGFPSLEMSKNGWRGVRTARYTYAWKHETGKPWVLYDNDNDPYQMHNLVTEPDSKALRNEMNDLLIDWLRKVEDPIAQEITSKEL